MFPVFTARRPLQITIIDADDGCGENPHVLHPHGPRFMNNAG